MRSLALAAIRGYQRWISPHKGFFAKKKKKQTPSPPTPK